MKFLLVLLTLFLSTGIYAETIDVMIKGIDDGHKNGRKHDYNQALMNAKLQAIEQSGAEISSYTLIENFKVKFDKIESKSKGLLLPGYKVMDMGYQKDGTYQVVLVGKVKVKPNDFSDKRLRYAISLFKRGRSYKAYDELESIINKVQDDSVVAKAMFLQTIFGNRNYSSYEIVEKMKSYYPNSPFISKLEDYFKRKNELLKLKNHKRTSEIRFNTKSKSYKRINKNRCSSSSKYYFRDYNGYRKCSGNLSEYKFIVYDNEFNRYMIRLNFKTNKFNKYVKVPEKKGFIDDDPAIYNYSHSKTLTVLVNGSTVLEKTFNWDFIFDYKKGIPTKRELKNKPARKYHFNLSDYYTVDLNVDMLQASGTLKFNDFLDKNSSLETKINSLWKKYL